MTLIIYLKCADSIIIISDKKQNDPIANHSQIIRKYFLPDHQEYVIALSGDGTRIDTITTPLDIEQTTADNVKEKIKNIVELPKQPNLGSSDGFLLILKKTPVEFYHIWTTTDKLGINHDNPRFECYGDGATLAKYFLHKFDLSSISWKTAIQYLISIMQEVAENNDSVGDVEKFGFDFLLIFQNDVIESGIIDKNTKIKKISTGFNPDDSFTLATVTKTSTTKSKNQIVEKQKITLDVKTNEKKYQDVKNDNISLINSLIVQSDKNVYRYNDNILLQIICPKSKDDSPIVLKIFNKNKKIIFSQSIPLKSNNNAIYHFVVPISGKEWDVISEEFKVKVQHEGKTGETSIWVSNFGATVELNQKVYSWSDRVLITIVAPDYSLDKDSPSFLGQYADEKITIRTSKGEIHNYKLAETGKNTGIFVGEVYLTGFKGHSGEEFESIKGITRGTNSGPTDGMLACSNEDHISVSFSTQNDTITGSALIRWNIGEIQWLKPNYSCESVGCVRVIDPDMNLNPNKIDEFKIRVWSNTDPKGIDILVYETNPSSGIFEGRVQFSSKKIENGLQVKNGDMVTAQYDDKTLPSPFRLTDEIAITATTLIGIISSPLEKISIENCSLLDEDNQEITLLEVKQKMVISASLVNHQQKSQPFLFLADIQDETGVTIQTPSITGSIANNSKMLVKLPWSPRYPGKYLINLVVWESINNPTVLSAVIPIQIRVNEIKNKISIPIGTHVSGCEKTNRCFLPSSLKIKKNHSVIWTNDDTAAHTITSGDPQNGPDGNFDSGLFMSGTSYVEFFQNKGRYPYFCMVHPWQTGVVEVE